MSHAAEPSSSPVTPGTNAAAFQNNPTLAKGRIMEERRPFRRPPPAAAAAIHPHTNPKQPAPNATMLNAFAHDDPQQDGPR
jgi:hypothetical protein